ncbi:MAG: SLC13 family permease [Planctomycetota bacterium]
MRVDRQLVVRVFVCIAIMVSLLLAQAEVFVDFGMTPTTHIGVAILVIAATLWVTEAVPLFLTGFVILALSTTWLLPELQAAGGSQTTAVFLSPFFSDIILLFLGGFVLSAALHSHRLDERLAKAVLRLAGDSLTKLLLAIMLVTAFLSMWLSNTATTAMVLSLVMPIVHSLPSGDRRRKAIVLAVPFAANIGGIGTPIGTPPNAIALTYLARIGEAPTFGGWMLLAIPVVVVLLALAFFVLWLVYVRRQQSEFAIDLASEPSPMTWRAWLAVATAFVTALGWLTGAVHGLSSGTIALIPVLVLFTTGVLRTPDFRGLPWDVLFVMGGGLCLGRVIETSGTADWLVAGLPTEQLGIIGLAVAVGVLGCAMSSVMSNTATANLLLPVIAGLGLAYGDAKLVMVGVAVSCSVAMVLPISTPPNAIAFSSSEIKSVDLMKPGLLVTVSGVIVTYTLGLWWWSTLAA